MTRSRPLNSESTAAALCVSCLQATWLKRSLWSTHRKWGKKRVDLCMGEKLELIKKLESGVSVVRVCDEHGVKKQTVSDIRRSKDKLTCYAMKFYVAPNKDRKGTFHERKHMKVPKSRDLEEAVYKW